MVALTEVCFCNGEKIFTSHSGLAVYALRMFQKNLRKYLAIFAH